MEQSTVAAPSSHDIVEAARIDGRSLARRLVAPLGTGALVGVGLGYLWAVDPNEPGHYPLCPTRAVLGIDCPGCGLLRGTHDLLHGDVAGAIDNNALLVVLVPVAILLWVFWLFRSWSGYRGPVTREQFQRRNRITYFSLAIVLTFGVIRNFVPYLSSGA
ncbi:MAG: DUF2752 domain-containing protein [Candidatus Nanopelagicales bacterium]|nr:DUF2752 domain-containing protein [Candidatus Nanopelagicales bacterium]